MRRMNFLKIMTNAKPLVTFEERYKALNKEQKRAVDTTEGPVLVVAGPGTGKTELISLRVGKILKNGTANANSILCLTFTETAATNMRDRLEKLIGPDAFRVAIYTFHGFCTEVMGKYPEYFYNASRMRPASELMQSEILEGIFARLPHKHPLGAYHPEMGYSYLKEAQSKIKDIKKGGLTPVRFKELIEENKKTFVALNILVAEYVPERIDKESFVAFESLHTKLIAEGTLLARAFAGTLRLALEGASEEGKNAPLSAWKAKYTGKDEDGRRVWKDSLITEKLLALADVYKVYQEELYRRGHFDYEDMIIEVVEALKTNTILRSELEEQYQYIMVDEFQDTNNAQLSLVKAISSSEVHEGHPNVCVVGDDDQAVYKFQGAEISNILSFEQLYKDVTKIVLVENYRSTQQVLDFARSIVTQGVERLERLDKTIRKDLVAKNKELAKGNIVINEFGTEEDEYVFVAEEVKKKLDDGEKASEIAIIAREHKQLRAVLPYLDALSVSYTYVREENVFDEPHVRELIMLCRFLGSTLDERFQEEGLLPEILSFPFWGLDRVSVWGIAEEARAKNMSWLSAMKDSQDKRIVSIASFLIELGVLAQTVPLEIILDTLIGARDMPQVTDDEHDDMYEGKEHLALTSGFVSPYKEFYFGQEVYKKNPSTYINFLSSLSVFVKALREYKDGEMLKASDVGTFVDMHVDYRIPLINNTPFAHNEDAVSLLTSHGAKGLEFACVFVVSVNDDIWAGRAKGNKLSFPVNLPLSQTPDDEDDFIRLFYVALTRARHTLCITHHTSPFRFLLHKDVPVKSMQGSVSQSELLATGLKVYHVPPFAHNEKALLKKLLDGYKLSPTHLNNFLDIVNGGPMKFLEQNLLRFPQAKTKSSVYGTAIHKALEDLYKQTKQTGTIPPLSFVLLSFEKELKRGRLIDYEEEQQKKRGEDVLTRYYKEHAKNIDAKTIVELDFSKQGVVIDGAQVTGKIDKVLEREDGSWSVVDIKTGKGLDAWDEKGTAYEKIKLHKYKHQLMMYKLLVEHARDYSKHTVTNGTLEFVEEDVDEKTMTLSLLFDTKEMKEELEQFKQLLSVVYEKIMNLDFPDTSSYPQNLDGILAFEKDLLEGRV
ncbi:MAG: ATP-dependent helicase UvrD/PcrA [Patescibacteria group bacterium]|nr:ATP-dependent helicase UvrD/PcrA [Patescibacteria group bacterium]